MEGDLKRNETVSPMAGKTPSQEMLVDVTRLEREYFERLPDVEDPTQLAASPNRLAILENDRWAEPLEENFARVLAQNLGVLLGGASVIRYPWQKSQRPTCQIEMEVLRFEPSADQQVELLAHWVVIDHSNKTRLAFKETRVARRTLTNSTEASVTGLSEALNDLSREIADTILARSRPDDR